MRQSRARLAIALAVAVAFGVSTALAPDDAAADRCFAIALGAVFYATAWLALIAGRAGTFPGRRSVAMLADLSLTGAALALGGEQAAPLYLLLVWAALDHGLRFGVRHAPFGVATLALAAATVSNPAWSGPVPLAVALTLLPAVLPLALAPLRAALSDSRRQVRHASDARRRLLAELERDFRTPLDAIVGVSKTLFATRLSPEQREGNELVQASAQGLQRRIGDAIDLAALETGALLAQPSDFNLRESLGRVRNQLLPLAAAKGLSLLIEVDDAIPLRLRGDARRVAQIFARMLQGAIDRTQHGSIRASIRRLPDRDARALLRISVRDTGAEGDLAAPGSDESPDLATAMSELLGGRSGREPNFGGGLHAWAELPFGVPEPLAQTDCFSGETKVVSFDDPLVRHRARVRPMRVLLADEASASRLVLQRLLERAGHEVVLVDDGEQALDRIGAGDVDAALVHLRLAGVSGLDVIRHARVMQAGARPMPVAILSGDAALPTVREAEAAGAFAFLTKPVVVPRLLDVLGAMSDAVRGAPATLHPVSESDPAIGLDVVQELMALDLGEGFVSGFVEQCLRDAGRCMAEMERCGAAAEWEGMRESAHALKGLSQNFAARAVAECCDGIVRGSDALLRAEWRRRVAQLDGLLQSCWRQVRSEMERLALAPRDALDPGNESR